MKDCRSAPPGVSSTGIDGAREKQEKSSTSAITQRKSILAFLQPGNQLTTLHAREYLGIMHPAMRVKELRQQGHNIMTHWRTEEDVTGTRHRIASYVLMTGKQEGAA